MVDSGVYQNSVDPGFERLVATVFINFGEYLKKAFVKNVFGFFPVFCISGTYRHAIIVEMLIQFFLALGVVFTTAFY